MGNQTSHLRKIFNYFDNQGKQYITVDDLLKIYKDNGHCKYQKYFNILFYDYFSGGTKKDIKLDFITFLQQILINKQSDVSFEQSNSLNTSHSAILNEIAQVSQSYSELTQQKIMHSDVKSRDIGGIALMLDNMRNNTQQVNVFSFNELLGLQTKDSSEYIVRSEYLNNENLYMRQYITEQDLALLLDFLADKQISIQHLLSQESVRAHLNVLEKIDFQSNDQKQQLAKILLHEYDITNTGKLSDIEYSKLIDVIQYELQTHMAFMGLHTTKIQNYLIGKTIGFGRTAICKCGIKIKNSDNKLYCLKIMKQQKLKLHEQMSSVYSSVYNETYNYCQQVPEKQIMELINKKFPSQNINILTMCDYFTYTDKLGEEWDVLVTDMCSGGNLAEYNKTTITTEQIARYLFYQIVLGVQQLHAIGIAHLDLRLENVLLNDQGDIRICDFGNALLFDTEEQYEGNFLVNMRAGTIAGTLAHMAPEMVESVEDFSAEAVDIYSLGLILYELLTKKKAFVLRDNGNEELMNAIVNSDYKPISASFTQEAAQLVQSLLNPDFKQRPTIYEILESPFLQLEMHKPAIASGLILLDPAPSLIELQKALQKCLQNQGFTCKTNEAPQSQNAKCLLTWEATSVHLSIKIACEEVKELGKDEDDLLLAARAVQTENGRRQLENVVLSSFKRGESAYKLVLSLKNGGLQDFQLIFKRIRYQLLQNFQSLIDQQHQVETNENPVIESIMYKQDVAKQFLFDSVGPTDSLNDLVNQTLAETDEGNILT